jgi:hypothetical protein
MSSQGFTFVHELRKLLSDTAYFFWYVIAGGSVPVESAVGLHSRPGALIVSFELDVQLTVAVFVDHLHDLGATPCDA